MNLDEITRRISDPHIDVDSFTKDVIQDEALRDNVVFLTTTHAHIMVYFQGYYVLDKASQERPDLFYKYWDDFQRLLSHNNSYHRDIALTILANLVCVDTQDKFKAVFDEYYSRLYDKKYMTGWYCIKNSLKVIKARTEYRGKILDLLLEHEKKSRYTGKQEALLRHEILEIIDFLYQDHPDRRLDAFILSSTRSISPKTRKKAKELMKKHNILAPQSAAPEKTGMQNEENPKPCEQPLKTEEELQAAHVGKIKPLNGAIHLAEYDPEWPRLFEREVVRIRAALGEKALMLEHVGSTSVPDLAAKPKIDLLLVVVDSADEAAYVPAMEAAGYVLHIREPDWFEHRMFKGPDTDINLHVFSAGCTEIERMLLFRNWLRSNTADRKLYENTKRELARRNWKFGQHYADAKTDVVHAILARAQEAEKGG